jgi:phage gp29-like protein
MPRPKKQAPNPGGKAQGIKVAPFPVQHTLNFTQVTPDKFRQAYKNARNGEPGQLYALMDFFLDMDGVLSVLLTQRKNAILTDSVQFQAADDSDEAIRQRDIFAEAMQTLGIRDLIDEIAKDAYYGLSMTYIHWDLVDGFWIPVDFEPLPLDGVTSVLKSDTFQLRDLVKYNKTPLSDFEDGIIITSLFKKIPTLHLPLDFTNMGRGLPALRFAMAKYYNYEDWTALNEIFAIPWIIGYYMAGDPDNVKRLENQVQNAGNSTRLVVPEDSKIEIKDSPVTSGAETFEKLKNAANEEMAIAMLSQAGTTSDNKVGSYAAKKTLNGVRIETALADKHRHEQTLNAQLSGVFTRLNFANPLPPRCIIPVQPEDDLEAEMRIDRDFVKMAPLSKAYLYAKYDRPIPYDDDELVDTPNGIL